jgi:hypothetical protein
MVAEVEDIGGWVMLKWILQVGWGSMDWIYLAQDGDHWKALVTMVMNLEVPLNVGTVLSSCTTGGPQEGFSSMKLVSYV